MDYKAIEKRLQAAQTILQADSLNRSTFDSLKTLLSGINPKLDHALSEAGKAFKHLEHLQKSDVIALVAEGLPEVTPEQKKQKKVMLLFFKYWNDLKSEVARVEKELNSDTSAPNHNAWGKIFALAKGPLGIVTLVAAGIVMLEASEVSIVIDNNGCGTFTPPAINAPGLTLPKEIPADGLTTVKMPPVNFSVDATAANTVHVSFLGISHDVGVDARMRATFDGQQIMGTKTDIRLGSQKNHTLVITCT